MQGSQTARHLKRNGSSISIYVPYGFSQFVYGAMTQ